VHLLVNELYGFQNARRNDKNTVCTFTLIFHKKNHQLLLTRGFGSEHSDEVTTVKS